MKAVDYLVLKKCMQFDLSRLTLAKTELSLTDEDITFILFARAIMVTKFAIPKEEIRGTIRSEFNIIPLVTLLNDDGMKNNVIKDFDIQVRSISNYFL
jgi:hypothetical protein